MAGLFKKLGKGIMFIFILPFWVVVFLLFTIYAIGAYFFTLFSAIPAYLRGESVLSPTEIDIAASTKLAEQKKQSQMAQPAPIVQPQTTIILNAVPVQQKEETPITFVEHEKAEPEMQQLTEQDFKASLPEEVLVGEEEDN